MAIGNSRNPYRLIRNIGPRKPSVSEVIEESDGTLTHSQVRRLARWAEHFSAQFSWPIAIVWISFMPASEPMEVDISPPS